MAIDCPLPWCVLQAPISEISELGGPRIPNSGRPSSSGSGELALKDAFRTPEAGMLGIGLFSPRTHSALDFSALGTSDLSLLPDMGDPLSLGRSPRGPYNLRPASGGSSIRQGGGQQQQPQQLPAVQVGPLPLPSLRTTSRHRPGSWGSHPQQQQRQQPGSSVMQCKRKLSQAGENTTSISLSGGGGTPSVPLFKQPQPPLPPPQQQQQQEQEQQGFLLFSPGASMAPSRTRNSGRPRPAQLESSTTVRVQHEPLNAGGQLEALQQVLSASGREVATFSGALPLLHLLKAAPTAPAAAATLRQRIHDVTLGFCSAVQQERPDVEAMLVALRLGPLGPGEVGLVVAAAAQRWDDAMAAVQQTVNQLRCIDLK